MPGETESFNRRVYPLSQEWYVYKDGRQQGPLTWEQLWQQAQSGAVQPGDQVWKQGMAGWTRADQVQGLMPAAPAPVPPPAAYIPPPGAGCRPAGAPKKGKGGLIALILILLLVLGGGGITAVYFLFLRDGGLSIATPGGSSVVGSWHGVSESGEEGYIQFKKDGTVNIAAPEDGVWFSAEYKLETEDGVTYLLLYSEYYDDWDRFAEIRVKGKSLILTSLYDDEVIALSKISDQDFQKVIAKLDQETW